MSRAKWKSPYVKSDLLIKFFAKKDTKNYQFEITTKSRATTVIPCFVGKFFNIHNGNNFSKILITENMIGSKLGEFSPTRKKFSLKKKKLK